MRLDQPDNLGRLWKDMAALCTSCGACVTPCAFLRREGSPAAICRRQPAAQQLDKAYDCSLCGQCDALCPEGLRPSTLFLAMRQTLVRRGGFDARAYSGWLRYEKLGNHPLFRRHLIPRGCTTVFFPGCSLPGSRPEGVRDLFRRLRQQDGSIGLVLDCCGKISHDLGREEPFTALFNRLADRLLSRGVHRVLTACPGCSKIFRQAGSPFEVKSVYEVLVEGLGESRPGDTAPTVAIHDPCPARFDAAQQQAVRTLVSQAGWRIEELPESGPTTRCCGQGGMVEGKRAGTVSSEAHLIAAQAQGRPLVTSCAACAHALEQAGPVAHVADLMAGGGADFTTKAPPSAVRWLNRLGLRLRRTL
ncbi:(Fe-S)-binding protein [Desulfuromonas sp. AOP6]|uniref:(Fe-S)-binding protein n=1 Tax=Desulfuromonas sp. AOP6 TaxID=1566351 RepID=UPI00128105D2|nr:(Fe-S)-binding protein [Desulfuromonas sp. AOP6]BCA81063.1 hypothetical protein AOP6_2850 [Desulfuromonas sp. AOP6]